MSGEPAPTPIQSWDLPEWLTALQAITWLVTADADLTMRAGRRPSNARPWGTSSPQGVGQDLLGQDRANDDLPVIQTETTAASPATLSPAARMAITDDPEPWGGVTSPYLAIRTGDAEAPGRALRDLMTAVRAGRLRALLVDGDLPSDGWTRLSLRQNADGAAFLTQQVGYPNRDGGEYVVDWKDAPRLGGLRGIPMFRRDDVLALRQPADRIEAADASPPATIRTGAPGRPTSMHLIRAEHDRRIKAGLALRRVIDEASHLAAWLSAEHPTAPQPTPKTIANGIRAPHRVGQDNRNSEP